MLIGFSGPTACMRRYRAGQRNRAFALTIKPAFFERLDNDVTDSGLAAIRALMEPDGRGIVPSRSGSVLAALADEVFQQRYGGYLGVLYQESLALRFIAEAGSRLHEHGRLRHLLGSQRAERVRDARDILDATLTEPPGVLDLARAVGTNATNLQRAFRQAFGTTIFGYVRLRRLEMARILIVEQSLGIAEAGYRVGFTNAAAFTAAFRRHFGHTPSRSRANAWSTAET